MKRRIAAVLVGLPATLAAGLVVDAPVRAQPRGVVELCRALPTEGDRFACMEQALANAQAALRQQQKDSAPSTASDDSEASAQDQELGADQIGDRNGLFKRDEERVRATIVSFREYLPGLLQFDLDNGQVWRQIDADRQRVRLRSREPLEVEMWASWAGGYRMHLVDMDRTLLVERLR